MDHKLPFYYESQTCCLFTVNSNPKQVTFLCNQKHKGKNSKYDAEEHFILNTGGYGFCCGGFFVLFGFCLLLLFISFLLEKHKQQQKKEGTLWFIHTPSRRQGMYTPSAAADEKHQILIQIRYCAYIYIKISSFCSNKPGFKLKMQ